MKQKHYLSTIILLLFGQSILFAQNEKLRLATIPIQLIENNKHILIQAKVNNEKTLTFYFDTGAVSSMLDKESAQNLNIIPNYEQEIEGAGGKIKYLVARNQKINFENIEVDSVDLVLEDLGRLKKQLGHNFDGIIGYSLLKNYISEININDEAIHLYPKNEKLDLSGYSAHSFTLDRGINIPQLDTEIELKNGEKFKGKVFFDSGAGLTLLINTPFKEQNQLVGKSKKMLTTFTQNLSTKSKSQEIALKSLTFAGHTFYNVPVGLTSDEAGVSSYDGYLGILGAEIINRFNIILDYDAQKMYLKPSVIYGDKFSIPLTGFSLKEEEENQIIISNISEESPAYKKGIRKGDQITAIKGVKDFSLKACNELLKQEGKRIKLTIKNESGVKTYKIKLKELL